MHTIQCVNTIVHLFAVLGLDYVVKDNVSEYQIPKYNNKVQNPDMFDSDTSVTIPAAALSEPSMAGRWC